MNTIFYILSAAVLLSSSPQVSTEQHGLGHSVSASYLIDRYCLQPDGDIELTWAIAVHDGFTKLEPSTFEGLRLPGAHGLAGFSKAQDGIEVRVLTAKNSVISRNGRTFFHLCWISADPIARRDVDRDLSDFLAVGRFKQEGAFVYAWIPKVDGSREPVSRRSFERHDFSLARDQGMRIVLTNQYLRQVSVTYMTPVVGCGDRDC